MNTNHIIMFYPATILFVQFTALGCGCLAFTFALGFRQALRRLFTAIIATTFSRTLVLATSDAAFDWRRCAGICLFSSTTFTYFATLTRSIARTITFAVSFTTLCRRTSFAIATIVPTASILA